MKSVLVVSNLKSVFDEMTRYLHGFYKVDAVKDPARIFEVLPRKRYEFVFIDSAVLKDLGASEPSAPYRKGLQRFWEVFPTVQVIVLSSQENIREAVNAVKEGASNYLTYPLSPDELNYMTARMGEYLRVQSELDFLRDRFWQEDSAGVARTESPIMRKVLGKIRSVAPTKSTVLLLGETGTGKGVMAKLIHRHSSRSDKQFISVHCGAINDTLLESELFGHEKGSFTGAIRRKMGKFEIAHKGTIFLDEIGAVSASMQIKLLKVLQERTFERVGGEDSISVDVRIIAATNSDLKAMTLDGSFRRDLFYRLNVFPIEVPPLSQRIEDIPILTECFVEELNRQYFKNIRGVHPLVLQALSRYSWPGNIRELENLIERAYILENSPVLTPAGFPRDLFENEAIVDRSFIDLNLTLEEVRKQGVEEIERQYLKNLLFRKKGVIKDTANAAGVGVRQLHKLLTKYGIKKEEYKNSPELPKDIGIESSDVSAEIGSICS